PLPAPMPPPEPPPKPFELPPPIAPALSNGLDMLGRLATASEAFAFLLVMRVLVLASDLMFLGWSLVLYSFAFGPPAPPPAPVAKVFGSFLPAPSVTVETTQTIAISTRMTCTMTDNARPSPPRRCQRVRLGRAKGSVPDCAGGVSWGSDIGVFHYMEIRLQPSNLAPNRHLSESSYDAGSCPAGFPLHLAGMDDRQRALEERLTFLQRHVEQQDRIILELSREVSKLSERLARTEAKVTQSADAGDQGPPADERPPHW
ncbi:MAG: SlyX family protein, partial [Verrucomicrobia bacterium]|nr:SlyX family protein [Verrucomicrobiota bacterium]